VNRIVVFHADCNDGFCAAWVAALSMPDDERRECRFVPARYGNPLPDGVDGAEVIVVDFSYPLPLLEDLFRRALSVWVLDHHLSSAEVFRQLQDVRRTNKGVIYDESKSGAGLAWDHLGAAMPDSYAWLVKYVEDRDLWRFRLPRSREVSAAIRALPASDVLAHFDAWCSFAERGVECATVEGCAMVKAEARYVERAVARASLGSIGDCAAANRTVPIVCETHLTSEVLHALFDDGRYPYAVGWSQLPDGRYRYSLRSGPKGADVSEIAKTFEGGGHRHAAGFETGHPVHSILRPLVSR